MGLLNDALTQARVWGAYARLNGTDMERDQAIDTLIKSGAASLTCMRLAINQTNQPRTQFGAAIVLHRLGDPLGMIKLLEALQWRLPATPALAPDLEAALIRVGCPDAVTALLEVWKRITEINDQNAVLASICRVWAALRDPRALDPLSACAPAIPQLFLSTIPWFGEMAVLHLERMIRDGAVPRRLLGIQALSRVKSVRGYDVLVPFLKDRDPDIRSAIPAALEIQGGAKAATNAIVLAMKEGYSTRVAVETLAVHRPEELDETLLALIARWNPSAIAPSGDTSGAVQAAIGLLGHGNRFADCAFIVCDLLGRKPDAAICIASLRFLALRGSHDRRVDATVRAALFPLLAHTDGQVREQAARALQQYGEAFGVLALQALANCRPQGNVLHKLQAILRGGPDAGQVATQAVQQVGEWLSRFSRETIEKLSTTPAQNGALAVFQDPRFPELLRSLLGNSLDLLQITSGQDETEQAITLAVSALRALSRLEVPLALTARNELLRGLRVVKRSNIVEIPTSPTRTEMRDIGELVRMEAASTLVEIYGKASYSLFVEALYTPDMEARITAVAALGRLGEVRAVPLLKTLSGHANPSLAVAANEALASIRRTNPEMMTLLRASSAITTRPDQLLRPSSGVASTISPDLLLRPTAQQDQGNVPHKAVPEQ